MKQLTKEQEEKGIELMRKQMGISGDATMGTSDGRIELGYRILQPNELAAATGFPKDYKFTGCKTEVVKQIGNAVPPNFAKAMFGQILKEMVA